MRAVDNPAAPAHSAAGLEGLRPHVVVETLVPPDKPGGVERFVQTLVRKLDQAGYEATVVHRGNGLPRWLPQPRGRLSRHLGAALEGFALGWATARAVDDRTVAVLTQGPVGWFLPLGGRSVRRVHFYHGTYRGQADAIREQLSARGHFLLKWWYSMALERWSGRGKLCISNSERTREEVLRMFGLPSETVWLPLDLAHFRPLDRREARSRLGLAADGATGVFVGSAEPVKGFPLVEQLIERFPDVRWLLVLRGEVPVRVRTMPRVTVVQDAGYDDLPTLYSAADFSVCPSRYESFAYVVAEALACGTPVVAAPGGASDALVRASSLGDLYVDQPDDVEAFAGAIERVLADPSAHRERVTREILPRLRAMMEPDAWWQRFAAAVGLDAAPGAHEQR